MTSGSLAGSGKGRVLLFAAGISLIAGLAYLVLISEPRPSPPKLPPPASHSQPPALGHVLPFTPEDFDKGRDQLNDLQGVFIDKAGNVVPHRSGIRSKPEIELLSGDPFLQDRLLSRLPALASVLRWWGEEGRPEALSPAMFAQHRKTDAAFVAQGQLPLFAPFLDLRAAHESRPLSPHEQKTFARAAPDIILPREVRGWFRVYLDEIAGVVEGLRRKDAALRKDPSSMPGIRTIDTLGGEGSMITKALTHSRLTSRSRIAFQPFLSDEIAATHRAHLALGRSLREEPSTAMLAARAYGVFNNHGVEKMFVSHLSTLPLELLLGPSRDQTPAFALVQFDVLKLQLETMNLEQQDTDQAFQVLRHMDALASVVVEAGKTVSPAARLRIAGLRIEVLLKVNEIDTARQEFRRFYGLLQKTSKRSYGLDWFQQMGAVALLRSPDPANWKRSELQSLWDFVRRHPKTPGELSSRKSSNHKSKKVSYGRRRYPAASMKELTTQFEALIAAAPAP